jgi:hypothetical protein
MTLIWRASNKAALSLYEQFNENSKLHFSVCTSTISVFNFAVSALNRPPLRDLAAGRAALLD